MNDGLSALCLLARYGTIEAFNECYNRYSKQSFGNQWIIIPPHPNLYFQAIVFNSAYGAQIVNNLAHRHVQGLIDKFVSLAQIDDQIAHANRGRGKRYFSHTWKKLTILESKMIIIVKMIRICS
jgi:hypothetical protein